MKPQFLLSRSLSRDRGPNFPFRETLIPPFQKFSQTLYFPFKKLSLTPLYQELYYNPNLPFKKLSRNPNFPFCDDPLWEPNSLFRNGTLILKQLFVGCFTPLQPTAKTEAESDSFM
ncbi:hypothetical protein AMTRI_Chr13g83220 [Amborella trichopoda]